MDFTNKLFIIKKCWNRKREGKTLPRRFYRSDDADEALALARRYAAEKNNDFLLVQVVAEASVTSDGSRPDFETIDVHGLLFLIEKHISRVVNAAGGRKQIITNRRYYEESELDNALELAGKYTQESNIPYLVVKVLAEVARSPDEASIPI
jgi:hypothetical protein